MKLAITGATGFLGSALLRHALADPSVEVVRGISRDEAKQAALRSSINDSRARIFLGDVRSRERMVRAFYGCDTVIHTAALKRVEACAYDPGEAIQTNINGTVNVVEAAIDVGVEKVIVISTDKACEPTTLYGVSKLAAEQYSIAANVYGFPRGTSISVVRYGNVLGSTGSVITLWREQAARGEDLTITDHSMTRFWLTRRQAVNLVWWALNIMNGGETFVPLLKSAQLIHLARAIAPNSKHILSGVRPAGEKFHETLVSDDECRRSIELTWLPYSVGCIRPWWHPWCETWPWSGAPVSPHTSDYAERLTIDELRTMVKEEG